MPELEGAVAEAPVESSVSAESVSTSEDTGQSSEVESQGTETQTETEGQQTEQQTTGKFDATGLIKDPQKREALKALDPSLPGFIRDAVWSKKQADAAGGLPALLETHKYVTELGGREFVEQAKTEIGEWEALDKAFTEGRPEFVKNIAQSDPEAFEKMVPLAIQEFANTSPEQYQHIMARVMVNTFDGVGLTNALKGLLQTVGDGAKQGLQEVIDWVESFRATASKVPEKKIDPERQKFDQERQQFAQKQAELLVKSVDADSIRHRDSVIAREIKPFGDWETMDQDRKSAVASWISQRIGKQLGADKGFLNRRDTLIANGDREGLAKLEQAKLDDLVPKLVPSAAKVFGVTKSQAKVQEKAKPGTVVARPKGVTLLQKAPSADQIDRFKTKPEDIFKNQAVLKNGTRVQWA